VAFRHPLLASAAVDALATSTRIALSRALAAAVNDPVERAGYLQADLRADADLAEQLEQAARAAAERGAADTAAALARSCVTATPPDAPPLVRVGRHILHGQWELYSGRVEPAREALGAARELLADVPPDQPDRAAAAESCAFFDAVSTAFLDDVVAAASITERALETVRDPGLRARLHRQLLVMVQHVDITRGAELAEQFFGAGGEHAGDPESVGVVLTARAAAGHPVDVDAALAEAELLEPAARDARLRQITELLVWTDHPRTGEVIERAVQHLDRLGFRIASLQDLSQLTIHQFLRGDWAAAERGLEHLTEYSHEHSQPDSAAGQLALLRAGQGRSEEAERIVAGLERRLADASADPAETLWVATRVGVTAHTLGHPDAADRLLTAEQLARDLRTRAVRGLNCRRDLVEALVAAGRLDEALDASARLSDDAAYNRVATALADADAAAGVVAAASGDFDTATTRFAAAAETQRAHGLRYEVARTLLAAGSAARRGGARGVAREHLDEALALFTSMGASAWARRCADELERIKGRRASDQSGELSPSEHQVAELVAAGRTNAEIAAALFVSVRTVESHLTRTYRKLGVRSRTELTARVNAGGLTVAP